MKRFQIDYQKQSTMIFLAVLLVAAFITAGICDRAMNASMEPAEQVSEQVTKVPVLQQTPFPSREAAITPQGPNRTDIPQTLQPEDMFAIAMEAKELHSRYLAYDKSTLHKTEAKELEALVAEGKALFESEAYDNAYTLFSDACHLYDSLLTADQYTVQLLYADLQSFPEITLYITAREKATGKLVSLPSEEVVFMESTDGGENYALPESSQVFAASEYFDTHMVPRIVEGSKNNLCAVISYRTTETISAYTKRTVYFRSSSDAYTLRLSGNEIFVPEPTPVAENEKYLVAIDAGHQLKANLETEPIGPGATAEKAKVQYGTKGKSTGVYEYDLNLQIALMLQQRLEAEGYRVLMIRTQNDVNISNMERAMLANEAGADAFIRIHANNNAANASAEGAYTICPTKNSPYCSQIYEESRLLSECVLEEFIEATGAVQKAIWETDTMSGINWCTVPVTIIEMGYMSNPEEDERMQTKEYQEQMADGIFNGITKYLHTAEGTEE